MGQRVREVLVLVISVHWIGNRGRHTEMVRLLGGCPFTRKKPAVHTGPTVVGSNVDGVRELLAEAEDSFLRRSVAAQMLWDSPGIPGPGVGRSPKNRDSRSVPGY